MATSQGTRMGKDSKYACSVCHTKVGVICGPCLASEIRRKHEERDAAVAEKSTLEDRVNAALQVKLKVTEQQDARKRAEAKIEAYKGVIAALKKTVAQQRAATMRARLRKHERLLDLQKAKNQLHLLREQHNEATFRAELTTLKTKYQDARQALSVRRRELAHQLLGLFPVSEAEYGAFSIAGVRLPTQRVYTGEVPGVVVSAALGTSVHLIKLLAKYLTIPLPYDMKFEGSRSVVWSGEDKPRKFPLYYEGGEAAQRQSKAPGDAFHYGLHMLNVNIVAMNFWYGVDIPSAQRWQTLSNLLALYQLPCLGLEPPVTLDLESLPPSHPLALRVANQPYRRVTAPETPKPKGMREGSSDADDDWETVEAPIAPPPSDDTGDMEHFVRTIAGYINDLGHHTGLAQ